MNALTEQVLGFFLAANGVKRPQDFYNLDKVDLADPSMIANPCPECEGRGECEHGFNGNDPDAETYLEGCERCAATGNDFCPSCDNPVPLLVRGDGRCARCVAESAIESAEERK